MKKASVLIISVALLLSSSLLAQEQTSSYLPKGDPDKWNFEITPFLWLPVISGDVGSKRLAEDFDIPAIDLLSNLKMAFMITADISRGKFFASPTYFYTKLGSEEAIWTSEGGEQSIVALPDMKMNIVELIAGGRFRINDFLILDPFLGFRYTNYHIFGSVEGIKETNTFDETAEYWDPVVGVQMHYYPHPRVPIHVKADVGGFGVGSKLSWAASLNSGYTLSPSFDLLAGFVAYGTEFEKEITSENTIGLNMIMYGFDLGVTYHIPKRAKDKSVFKKKK